MTFNLFNLTFQVAREIGRAFEGTATGGSTTTIVDTVYLQDRFSNDHFNAGTAWITYDAGGASAAPEGYYSRISDFVSSSGTVTLATTLSAIAAGDRYALADDAYTLDVLISAINRALSKIYIPTVDITSITTADEQTEYTLPTGILDENIEVWLQRITTDSDDNRWIRVHDWYIQDTVTGSAKLLVFLSQPDYPYALKVVYWTPHPALNARTDQLREGVDINRIVVTAAYYCLIWKRAQYSKNDPELDRKIEDLRVAMEVAKNAAPMKRARPKLATLGIVDSPIGLEST